MGKVTSVFNHILASLATLWLKAQGAEDLTTFIPFGGSTLGFIHAFVAVFSGWRRDRCQTKALDLTMKELEVKRASAQPQNILSPSTQNDPDLS